MLAEAQLFPLEKSAEQRLLTLKAELRKYKFHEIYLYNKIRQEKLKRHEILGKPIKLKNSIYKIVCAEIFI